VLSALDQTLAALASGSRQLQHQVGKVCLSEINGRKDKILGPQVKFTLLCFLHSINMFVCRMKIGVFEELKCQILAQGRLDSESLGVFVSELQGVSQVWKLQLEEKEKKAREDQSLYKMKTSKEIEDSELKKTFPMYHKEFEDVAASTVYIVFNLILHAY